MATLLLTTAAGSALSSSGAFAYALGTVAATTVGSMIDHKILGSKGSRSKTYGSRLNDLYIQSSAYGTTIPEVFGTVKIAGNIIWSMPLKETTEVQSSSARVGKGGGRKVSQTQTTYVYYATLAIALCKGEIDEVSKIWVNDVQINPNKISYRVYKGCENQLPDSAIESFEGVGKAPAYRGIAYVVIENFSLAEYGNRMPNFAFEVVKKPRLKGHANLEERIEAITIIPGSGECVYDTEPSFKVFGKYHKDKFIQKGKKEPVNLNNREYIADASLSLKQLSSSLPNLKWVSVAVCWFANSLNIDEAKIMPGVEFKDAETLPDYWQVGKYNRRLAAQIGFDKNGNIRYGGTPLDASLKRFIKKLKEMGYNVMLYPMIMLDIEGKPWRGHMTGSNVDAFFNGEHGYNNFIMHYASEFGSMVDAIAIGSELKGITAIKHGESYPAVKALINLADKVKPYCKAVTYAADWSEYHHDESGNYNLDELWASSSIDYVGIDAYFPVPSGWQSGEFYDDVDSRYALKNIRYWWENYHYNNGEKTLWQPKMKKIWFTEYGFPSVDACANQPNVFYDPESVDGGFPKGSNGSVDFDAQYKAISDSLAEFKTFEFLENAFLWCWDARPYPYFPMLKDKWRDHNLWKTGHFINGKIGKAQLASVVSLLMTKAGYKPHEFDVAELKGEVSGFVISEDLELVDALKLLASAYFFCFTSEEGIIKFKYINNDVTHNIDKNELIMGRSGSFITLEKPEESQTYTTSNVLYISRSFDYQQIVASKRREGFENNYNLSCTMPLVLSDVEARKIAEYNLYIADNSKVTYKFTVPYKNINVADLVILEGVNLKAESVTINPDFTLTIEAEEEIKLSSFDTALVDDKIKQIDATSDKEYVTHIFELPNYFANSKDIKIFAASASLCGEYKGLSIYDYDTLENITDITAESVIGNLSAPLPSTSGYVIDEINKISISTLGGDIFSSEEFQFCLIGDEVIAFKNVHISDNNEYELSYLIRGFGQDRSFINSHDIGTRFILLDKSISSFTLPLSYIGTTKTILLPAYGENIAESIKQDYVITGQNVKPLAPQILGENLFHSHDKPWEIRDYTAENSSNIGFIKTIDNISEFCVNAKYSIGAKYSSISNNSIEGYQNDKT